MLKYNREYEVLLDQRNEHLEIGHTMITPGTIKVKPLRVYLLLSSRRGLCSEGSKDIYSPRGIGNVMQNYDMLPLSDVKSRLFIEFSSHSIERGFSFLNPPTDPIE